MWLRIADARLAVWDDESVLFHIQSGNSYWFQGRLMAELLAFCIERSSFDDAEFLTCLTLTDTSQADIDAALQSLVDIHFIAPGS